MNTVKTVRGSIALFITALIWGITFVFQSTAMDNIGPLLFCFTRFIIGGTVLLPVIFIMHKKRQSKPNYDPADETALMKLSIKGGIACGLGLLSGSLLQQFGLITTSPGKAGFITALYIILVPIAGIFLGRKLPRSMWLVVIVAIIGFYLLSIKEGFTLVIGDLYCLLCAFGFMFQILFIDHYTSLGADPIILSSAEFYTVSVLLFIPMLIFEGFNFELIKAARVSILYCGIMASGVAYTLQVVGQKYTPPAVATLIMSLESVFAALAGWIILHEALSLRETIGAILVFGSVIAAQFTVKEPDSGYTNV